MNRKFTIPINKICKFPTRLGNRFAYPVVVYSAFPKSGSQSNRELIRQVHGTRTSLYIPKIHIGFGNNIISPDKLPRIKQYFKPCLIYGHITPTAYNISELNKGCSKYFFVSIRGLKDVIISYKEHIDKTGFGPLDYRLPGLSEGLPNWPAMAVDNADGNRLRIVRSLIQCCAAHARQYSNIIEFAGKAPALKEMTWVKVVGTMSYKQEGGKTVPVVIVKEIKETTNPDDPFLR